MSVADPESPFPIGTLVIAGVGLIGGAIAQHARQHRLAKSIVGLGRDRVRLAGAVVAGVIDRGVTDPNEIGPSDLAIVCTPVDRIVDDVRALASLATPPAAITDAGSVKETICTPLAEIESFVGSHPLAGSEKSGYEYASAVLFRDRVCVLTPNEKGPQPVTVLVESFWKSIGMQTVTMSAAVHDRILARTSHFPHRRGLCPGEPAAAGRQPVRRGGVPRHHPHRSQRRGIVDGDSAGQPRRGAGNTPGARPRDTAIEQALEHRDRQALEALLRKAQQAREALNG